MPAPVSLGAKSLLSIAASVGVRWRTMQRMCRVLVQAIRRRLSALGEFVLLPHPLRITRHTRRPPQISQHLRAGGESLRGERLVLRTLRLRTERLDLVELVQS